MDIVKVVDARMGRGKTSAAINYINSCGDEKKFLFVTPYLTEVKRICVCCDFEEPDDDFTSKSFTLKSNMSQGNNIAATHSLFYLMDDEALSLARDNNYSIIIDESIQTVEQVDISKHDTNNILENFADEDSQGFLHWRDPEYTGKFYGYKEMADANSLLHLDSALINIMSPDVLRSFDEVIMLTYMFDGQYQQAYLKYFDIPYNVVGVVGSREDGYYFSDKPDDPPPVDYGSLINMVCIQSGYDIGEKRTSLSKNWFVKRNESNKEIRILRNSLDNFFSHICSGDKDKRIWTSFKDACDELTQPRGRYKSSFIPLNARATNEYRECTDVAYIANRFANPNIVKFFAERGVGVDQDSYALSEMLQFIWRSAIRDDKHINLYIPSKRMRDLFCGWLSAVSKGGGGCV